MERGLLSDERLAEHYDDVVWMYLFQDFSGSAADRAAERVAVRFGISSWPQLLLIDPHDLRVIGETGRNLESFTAAVAAAKVGGEVAPTPAQLAAHDALADRIVAAADAALARDNVTSEDRVVRYFAVERLAREQPAVVVEHAARLLRVPHDQLRYAVCAVLAEHGDPSMARALDALLRDPGPDSHNPNVVRCRAAQALGRCGDAASVAALAPFARSGAWNNALTRLSVTAVGAIGARRDDARAAAFDVLVEAFPAAPVPAAGDAEPRTVRAVTSLARHVHETLAALRSRPVAFPATFDAEGRAALVAAWRGRRR